MGLDALIERLQSESIETEGKHNKNNVVTSVTPCNPAKVTEKANKNNVVTPVTFVTSKKDNGQTEIAELKREQRRQKVLTMLEENPDQYRAFYVDPDSDLNSVAVAIAIRDLASFELEIPRHKYDPFLLLESLNIDTYQ